MLYCDIPLVINLIKSYQESILSFLKLFVFIYQGWLTNPWLDKPKTGLLRSLYVWSLEKNDPIHADKTISIINVKEEGIIWTFLLKKKKKKSFAQHNPGRHPEAQTVHKVDNPSRNVRIRTASWCFPPASELSAVPDCVWAVASLPGWPRFRLQIYRSCVSSHLPSSCRV